MRAYLVRLKENAELVGIFVSPTADTLWDCVDECCPPEKCQSRKLPPGGIYLPRAGAARIPTIWSENDDDDPDWFAGATLSELWLGIFSREEGERGWKDVVVPDADG